MSDRQSSLAMRAAALAASVLAGCASLGPDGAGSGSSTFRKSGSEVRRASFEDDKDAKSGLSWSDFQFDNLDKTAKKLTGNGPDHDLARQRYGEAEDLYRQAVRAEPEQRGHLFALAAPKFLAAAERWPDSQLAMDALYWAGESYFFADNYNEANLTYEKLIKAFPNNRYLDAVDQRRFTIAKYWLDLNHDHAEPFYYANWFNKERPWRDARGSGLRVFGKICVDDPTGRLADDATLAAGNEYFSRGEFMKADDKYSDLRKAYPTSEHQFLAHFLGLKAKLECYQGPAYGGTVLDEAEKLIKQMRRQFPQEAEKERLFLDRAAAEIRFRKAERLMYLGSYHDKRAEYRAADHYYAQVVRDFPDTPLAQKADERVAQIAGLPAVPAQKLPWLVNALPQSDKIKTLIAASDKVKAEEEAARTAQQPTDVERR
jgi:TolA-binding protein